MISSSICINDFLAGPRNLPPQGIVIVKQLQHKLSDFGRDVQCLVRLKGTNDGGCCFSSPSPDDLVVLTPVEGFDCYELSF